MNLLLTVLTLLAAVLAITPRERQLDIRVRVRAFDWLLISAAVVLAICLEFYEFLQGQFRWLPTKECWPQGITPTNATYLIILIAVIVLWCRLRFARLTRSTMPLFRDLVEELYWNGNYGELFALLQTHLKSLFRIYSDDFFLPNLRRKLNPLRTQMIDYQLIQELRKAAGTVQDSRTKRSYKLGENWLSHSSAAFLAWRVVSLLPVDDKAQDSAQEILRGVFLAPRFLSSLAQTRPYLGLEIIKQFRDSFERGDFVNLFVKELLRDPHSIFFRELQNNQNVRRERYLIQESNQFLYFFLNDAKIAEKFGIYKPIGDFVISYLDELAHHPSEDTYNRANDNDFESVGLWHSPLFGGVRFFDIMVKEALFQGIEWHMWLYYMPPIVERIVRNYRLSDPLANEAFETPTRYSYILYLIFSYLRDWILAVKDLPHDQPNVVLESTRPDHENGNIPKSSILAISECLYSVLQSQSIGASTKRSLALLVFNIYFDLRASGHYDPYAEVLINALINVKSYRKECYLWNL